MYDVVAVQIGHSFGDFLSPIEYLRRCDTCAAMQEIEQRPVPTVLHDNTWDRPVDWHASEANYEQAKWWIIKILSLKQNGEGIFLMCNIVGIFITF